MFSKTFLKTNSLARNVCGFTRRLCKFTCLYWYDVIRTIVASRSSSIVSRSLAMASTFTFSRTFVLTMGISISMGMMASIPYVKENSDTLVSFQLVVL